jgi:hypothetical protein
MAISIVERDGHEINARGEISGDRASLCAGHRQLGIALLFLADFAEFKPTSTSSSLYDEADPSSLVARGSTHGVWLRWRLCSWALRTARAIWSTSRYVAERREDPFHVAAVYMWAGAVYVPLRDPRATLDQAEALNRPAPSNSQFGQVFATTIWARRR